jgi:hypothetical protein
MNPNFLKGTIRVLVAFAIMTSTSISTAIGGSQSTTIDCGVLRLEQISGAKAKVIFNIYGEFWATYSGFMKSGGNSDVLLIKADDGNPKIGTGFISVSLQIYGNIATGQYQWGNYQWDVQRGSLSCSVH